MKKFAVTLLTTSFPTTTNPSSGIFIARLARHLSQHVTVTIVTPSAKESSPIQLYNNINVCTYKYAPEKFQVLAHQAGGIPVALKNNRWLYLVLPLFFIAMAYSLIKCRKTDLIHAHWSVNGCVAGAVGLLLNKPVVTTLHGDDVIRAQNHKIDRAILWFCLLLNKQAISVNESFRTWITNTYPYFKHKIITIPNGIEDSFLAAGSQRKFTSLANKTKIVTIGSLIPRKGIDIIIQAVALLRKQVLLSLTIVGEGLERSTLEKLIKEKNLVKDVQFLNNVKPDLIPQVLLENDIFVLASHSEGRPSVILEAMATALPIIASNIPGNDELVDHNKTGLLFPDYDSSELARCIEKLATDHTLSETLGKNARDFIIKNELVWSDTARKHSELYATIVNR